MPEKYCFHQLYFLDLKKGTEIFTQKKLQVCNRHLFLEISVNTCISAAAYRTSVGKYSSLWKERSTIIYRSSEMEYVALKGELRD